MLVPMLLKEIVLKGDVAVKTYHASAPGVLAQLLATAGLETVAPANVPAVFEQAAPAAPGVKVVAPEQLSFAGGDATVGSTTHTVNVGVVALLVVILI